MAELGGLVLKICVVGSSRVGKTALCRALAEQPLTHAEYQPTCAVRIQEFGRKIGQEAVKVQLWDVAGQQYQGYWELLSRDVAGVMLLIDPEHPEQEQELEQLYLRFAQRNSLTMKQCLVLGLSVSNTASGSSSWSGLRGKLRKLPSGQVSINYEAPEDGRKAAGVLFDKLLTGCLAPKKDRIERAVMGD